MRVRSRASRAAGSQIEAAFLQFLAHLLLDPPTEPGAPALPSHHRLAPDFGLYGQKFHTNGRLVEGDEGGELIRRDSA
jgi:hypothetical protein